MGENDTGEGGRAHVSRFRSLVENQRYTFWNLTAGAVAVGVTVFLLGYGLALDGGFGQEYLRSTSVYLALIGIVGGIVILLWAAKYHLQVWEDVRRCFAVSDEAYDDLVEPVLTRAYDSRRVFTAYILALVLTIVVNWGLRIPIPWAITAGFTPETGSPPCLIDWPKPCIDYLSVINYLYGSIVLFVIVSGMYGITYFLSLATRITDLPLRNLDAAAERLEPIAKFSIFVSTSLFAGVILLLTVYIRLVGTPGEVADNNPKSLVAFLTEYALIVILVIAGLIFVGVLVFWLPQMAIHARLAEAKQDRLSALNQEYVALSERAQVESESVDNIAAELDVLDARRRNVKEIKTWAYNLPSLLPLVGSGIASAILWIIEVLNRL
ncbi:MAG: hypothetical protein V5A25_08190 [Halovenus sp.]